MEPRYEDTLKQGLRRYAGLVAEALGLAGDSYYVRSDAVGEVYLALDGAPPTFPDRDAALLWDEVHGWAVAVEARCGEELLVVGYFGDDLMPPPAVVARFVRQLLGAGVSAPAATRTTPA